MDSSFPLLSTMHFRRLDKWYVEYYLNSSSLESNYDMVRMEKLISPVKRRIKKNDYDGVLPVISKIVFKTGEIVFRKENKTGMDLLLVNKGDMLVSSINFHQGAVALNTLGDFVCSTHYQTFIINESKVIPEYLLRVIRSNTFISMVSGIKANGIKNESGFDFIGGLEIPLPTIPEQEKILKAYHDTLDESEKNRQSGDDFGSNLLYDIQSKVSDLKKSDLKINEASSIMQITSFTATKRWEAGYIFKEGRLEKIYNSFKYQNHCINELQTESLFGLSVKASLDKKKDMIPVLRMSNVINGILDFSELKYLPKKCAMTTKEPEKWLLKEGDFLITRTNGSKELVGKSAVFHGNDIYTYASYLIRYRFNTTIVLPEYINILFMTPLVREQIAVMRRQGGGQYNLNSDEIGVVRIPVPLIPEQQLIIDHFNSTQDGANKFYAKAEELKFKATTDLEKTIFLQNAELS
ncbi:MAG: restriction endonuclease subunit S [Synergistaceae bacterium]